MSLIILILMKFLVMANMTNVACEEIHPITLETEPNTPPELFYGKMMKSVNFGETWESINDGLSKDLDIRAMGINENRVFIGTTGTRLFSKELDQNHWVNENIGEAFINQVFEENSFISGIYTTKSGTFAHISSLGLLKKSNGKHLWIPFSKPEGVRFINDLKEDDLGNIYLSCQEGIFVSSDNGNTWDQIYMTSSVGNMVIQNKIIVSNSGKEITISEDRGANWQRVSINSYNMNYLSDNNTSYNVMPLGNKIAALRSEWPAKKGLSGKLQVSVDGGKTWKKHEADHYINQLEDVTSVVEYDGRLYCSYKEGVICSEDQGKNWRFLLKYQKDNNGPLLLLKISRGILYCWEGVFGC